MRTSEDRLNAVLVDGNLVFSTGKQRDAIIDAMQEYADQQLAEYKAKLKENMDDYADMWGTHSGSSSEPGLKVQYGEIKKIIDTTEI